MTPRMMQVEIRLRTDHVRFTPERQRQFVDTLAQAGECEPAQIRIRSVRAGCTVITAVMPASAVRQVAQAFYEYRNADATPEEQTRALESLRQSLRDLIVEHELDGILYESDLTLRIRRETVERTVVFVPAGLGKRKPFGKDDSFGDWPFFVFQDFHYRYPEFFVRTFPYSMGGTRSLVHLADDLTGWIQTQAANSKLAIVAHSFGGMLVRRAIVTAFENNTRLGRGLSHIAFVASPHDMVTFASAATQLPSLDPERRQALQAEQGLLHSLNVSWRRWIQQSVSGNCHLKGFYSPEDTVAPSMMPLAGERETLQAIANKSHLDLARPSSPDEAIAVGLHRFLLDTGFFEVRPDPLQDAESLKMLSLFFKDYLLEQSSARPQGPPPASAQPPGSRSRNLDTK